LSTGNILCLAGFGNLQGKLEFWDVKSQKLISEVSAKDSTYFGWAPDGCHAITATLSPRMRVGNGLVGLGLSYYFLCAIHSFQQLRFGDV